MRQFLVAGLAIARLMSAIASWAQKEQSDPDSYEMFDTNCYSEWIMIRSLMHELEAIYWVFLSTLYDTPPLLLI